MINQQQSTEEKFNKAVEKVGLTNEEKQNLDKLITTTPAPEEKKNLMELLLEKPELIKKLIENYKKKQEIIATQDKDAWQKLLKEEEKELEELAKE